MVKSKWDDMIADANMESKLTDDAKLQLKQMNAHIEGTRKFLKVISNFYLLFMFLIMFFLYTAIIRLDYFSIVLDVLFFAYTLFNFAEAYATLKVKIKVRLEEVK